MVQNGKIVDDWHTRMAVPSGRAVGGVGLRPVAYWDWGQNPAGA